MNHTVSIDLEKRNEARKKQIDSFCQSIIDAYIAGGGTKENAIKYLYDVYGYVHTESENN